MLKSRIAAGLAASILLIATSALGQEIRDLPARQLPLPQAASHELREMITAGSMPIWNDHPATAQEWKGWVAQNVANASERLPALHEKLLVEAVGPKVLCLGRTELGRSQTFGRQRLQRIGGGTIIKNMARQGIRCGVFCHECTARTDFLVFAVDNSNQKPSCFLACQPFMRHCIE